jgi:hypothetical protein
VGDNNSGDIDPKYSGAYLCSSGSEASALCDFNKSKPYVTSALGRDQTAKTLLTEPAKAASQVRNAYCAGDNQRLPVEEKFAVVVPLPPDGIPVNHANELVESFKQTARKRIKQIFMARPPDFDQSLLGEQNPKLPPFILSIHMNQESVRSFFKRQRLETKAEQNSAGIIAIREGAVIAMGWAPLSITTLEPNFMQDAFHMPGKIGQTVFPTVPSWHTTLPINPLKPLSTWLPYSRETLAVFEKKPFDSNNQVLIYTSWVDLETMKREFVLDVSESEQRKVFKKWPRGYDDRPYNRNVVGGNAEQGFMLRDRVQLWDHYIHDFTEVREEATSDPRTINFKARLDLGWFCKYGRPVQSLKSE